jgi:hypothetical protein
MMNVQLPAFDDDVWELYGPDDWTQSRNNIAAENPDKLAEAASGVGYAAMPWVSAPWTATRWRASAV